MFLSVCVPHPWLFMQAAFPTCTPSCTASGRYQPVTQLICMVLLHLVPSSHSEGLASKENQISFVSIHPGKRVAEPTRRFLLAELSAEGGWQGVFFECCPAPPCSLRGPQGHHGSCYGDPDSPVPTGSLTCWLLAPCGSAS